MYNTPYRYVIRQFFAEHIVRRLLMTQRISISLGLANYLYDRHLDCVTDGTGYETPEDIEPLIKRFRNSLDKARSRARVRAKVDSLLTQRAADGLHVAPHLHDFTKGIYCPHCGESEF